ncbi:hypothetical protein GCK72_026204 [Caenorhabditis remanei]|uniref:Uncharacterized protein n=1 Tax=Caenorhabditis remanei TaxID=31234 RepID=A0A6A5G4U0_CAERE|nr:hypothetical protein GCK72_026204 [Caenorhabditis remanei]KAF1749735.1 hypothetical protein GCK72_026204 [Caenorhabditis remanei]
MGRVTKNCDAKSSADYESFARNSICKRSENQRPCDPRLTNDDRSVLADFKLIRKIDSDISNLGERYFEEDDQVTRSLIHSILKKLDTIGDGTEESLNIDTIDSFRSYCVRAKDLYNDKIVRLRAKKSEQEELLTDRKESLMAAIERKLKQATQDADRSIDLNAIFSHDSFCEKSATGDSAHSEYTKSTQQDEVTGMDMLHGQNYGFMTSYGEHRGGDSTPQKPVFEFLTPKLPSESKKYNHKLEQHSSAGKSTPKTVKFTPYKIPQQRKMSARSDVMCTESPSKAVSGAFSQLSVSATNKQTSSIRNLLTAGGHQSGLPQETQATVTVRNTTTTMTSLHE